MKLKTLARGAALALVCLPFAACGDSSMFGGEKAIVVPSEAEAKAEADKQITADNAKDELDKLEKEIEADAAGK